MSHAAKVNELFCRCLYTEKELVGGAAPPDTLIIHGMGGQFCFRPEAVADAKESLRTIIRSVVTDKFLRDCGESLWALDVSRNGELWADTKTTHELVWLSIAAGLATYTLPRELWPSLPGGLPRVRFMP